MRLLPIAITFSIAAATIGSAGTSQQQMSAQINTQSVALTRQGEALVASGDYAKASDSFETALAVDPRNRAAYIGLARAAQGQGMPGKAIAFYAEALAIEPNDVTALAGQGAAMVERGAVERARQNLDKIRAVCKDPCPQAATLAAAIAKGPPPAVVTAEAKTGDKAKTN
ncbi:tetratricopeptide repeat protein [Allosphingosinicella flava]|uniref:Tetratricopeptide repeat protein n=2 Tax=Allosphingosinicella flava TaxID=2771430 RepID=A0A7T2GKR3_9SPHN|nr:tetratricopeptide repeat protein [Sphingosinicella flava]